jgi:hypothetical protein
MRYIFFLGTVTFAFDSWPEFSESVASTCLRQQFYSLTTTQLNIVLSFILLLSISKRISKSFLINQKAYVSSLFMLLKLNKFCENKMYSSIFVMNSSL